MVETDEKRAVDVAEDHDRPEPAEATHAAEDETWAPEAHAPDQQVEVLEAELARVAAELADTKERFLRARADYDNLSKRQARERDEMTARAVARVLEPLLVPVEALERAVADLAALGPERARGVTMVLEQFKAALAREGLEEVPGVGAAFDHHNHEAVAREPSDRPEGEILAVVRAGYRLHGKLLRPALVKVSSGPA